MKNLNLLFVSFTLIFTSSFLSLARANVVGADTQNFNPTTSGLDFVTVHSSETLKPGVFNFGLFLNYAVNSLPNYEDAATQSRTNFSDSLLSADMNFGVGLMRNWDVGFSVPVLLSQSVDSDVAAFRGEFAETGLTEFRANSKFRFLGDESRGLAVVASVNVNQIEENPFTGTEPGPTYNLELAGDTTLDGGWAVGANVGYRFRSPGEKLVDVPIEPFGDQMIASAAASYLIPNRDLKVITELFASFPMEDTELASDRELTTLEWLLGAKWDVNQSLAFHAGGGTKVLHGTASPDWRVYSGVNFAIGPLFGKQSAIYRVEEETDLSQEDYYYEDPYAAEPSRRETFRGKDILFEFNSDRVHPSAEQSMREFVAYVLKTGFKELVIEGHTDSVGAAAYNLDLSQRRASQVRKVMIGMGLPAAKVKAAGFGEARPIADNGNYQGRAINRRVEFQILR